MLVQPTVCSLVLHGLKCKLLFDVFELTNNCMQLTRTHQRYCLSDDCSEASRWSPHNRECNSCWWGMTREGVAVLLTTSRSEENSLSSRRRRLDFDEKNHLHCTCPMGILSFLFLSPPDSTFFAAISAMLSALNETPSARARYAVGWQLLAQTIHDDVLIEKGECPQLLRRVNGCRCWVQSSDRAHQAGCGFECSESIHKVNVELVEKPVNGPVHTPLLKPPSLPEKTCFFRFRTRFVACMRRTRSLTADWGGPPSCIFRSPMMLLEKCTAAHTSLEVARCASHGGAVSACHSEFATRESRPHVFILWPKSARQASKVAFSSLEICF